MDCSCEIRGQYCKAYCQLLQPPSGHNFDCGCHCSSRYHDPLRELNRSYESVCECSSKLPKPPSATRKPRILPNLQYPVLHCDLSDGEWNSSYAIRGSEDRAGDATRVTTVAEKTRCSQELRERYAQEMEVLKARLNLLKNGVVLDGKRSRRRSESEPGFLPFGIGQVNKRARGTSPSLLLSVTDFARRRDSRSVPPDVPLIRNHRKLLPTLPTPVVESCSGDQERGQDCRDEEGEDEELGPDDETAEQDECLGSEELNESGDSSLVATISPDSVTESSVTPIVPSTSQTLFRHSLFYNVPPYVQFSFHDQKGPSLPAEVSKLLKWRLSTITPIVIRRTLVNSGFKLVRKSNDWAGQWGKHMNSFLFKTLKDFQKLNHFPGTFQIGRKDRLWKNLNRLMLKFSRKEFGFMPTTYILPQDHKNLRIAWEKTAGKGQWIVKPPAAARGTGIRVVHRWADIPKNKPMIVQKYISQPYLINGSKFDLRLYVLVTSIHPLRIYLYDDGLVRFASVKYSQNMESLSDRYMHLTNYSINKLSNQYCPNEDATSCQGHKWTLKTLWDYLEKQNVNVIELQKHLTDLVIKTIIAGESHIQTLSKNNLPSRYCSYELFGIDVLLDSALRPWLLEVNISPSLHSSSPLDLAVKGPLVRELFNLAGFQVPARLSKEQETELLNASGLIDRTETICYDKRLYTTVLSREEKHKHAFHTSLPRKEYLDCILEELTPDDVRHLIQFEDELTQLQRFQKIFPTTDTHCYHQYFESPRYYNMMLDAWETKYHDNRKDGCEFLDQLCRLNVHLQVPFPGSKTKFSASQSDGPMEEVPAEETNISRKRRKHGLLIRPAHLRAAITARRLRESSSHFKTEETVTHLDQPEIKIPPHWTITTCKMASGSASQVSTMPFDISTTS